MGMLDLSNMLCPCCKKKFYLAHYEGGYIDHVENFAEHRQYYVENYSVSEMAYEIVFSGNDLREDWVRDDFINCFKSWDCFDDSFKNKVIHIVEIMAEKIKKADEEAQKAKDSMSPLARALFVSRKMSGEYYEAFDSAVSEAERDLEASQRSYINVELPASTTISPIEEDN